MAVVVAVETRLVLPLVKAEVLYIPLLVVAAVVELVKTAVLQVLWVELVMLMVTI